MGSLFPQNFNFLKVRNKVDRVPKTRPLKPMFAAELSANELALGDTDGSGPTYCVAATAPPQYHTTG